MGNLTPSKLRKQGREAFIPGETNPEEWFDWPKKSWYYKYHLEDFLEGWEEAKASYVEPSGKYKVNITLLDISENDYDCVIENIQEYLDNVGVDYNIGIGEPDD